MGKIWRRRWINYPQYVPGNTVYVAQIPQSSADWGYTSNPAEALPLSPYWGRRFAADCRRVGYNAEEVEV